jgi:hypothetical protein
MKRAKPHPKHVAPSGDVDRFLLELAYELCRWALQAPLAVGAPALDEPRVELGGERRPTLDRRLGRRRHVGDVVAEAHGAPPTVLSDRKWQIQDPLNSSSTSTPR